MSDDPDKDGEWHPFFAILPVWVDAYSESERAEFGGKFAKRAIGRVERRWDVWTDNDDDQTVHAYWRYRLPRQK